MGCSSALFVCLPLILGLHFRHVPTLGPLEVAISSTQGSIQKNLFRGWRREQVLLESLACAGSRSSQTSNCLGFNWQSFPSVSPPLPGAAADHEAAARKAAPQPWSLRPGHEAWDHLRLTSHSLQGSPSLGYGPGEGPEGLVGQQALAFEFSVRCSLSWVLGGCQSFCQFSRGRWSSGRSTNHCSIWGQLLRLGNSHPHFCQPLQRDDHNPHLCSHVCVIPHSLLWSHFGSPLQCVFGHFGQSAVHELEVQLISSWKTPLRQLSSGFPLKKQLKDQPANNGFPFGFPLKRKAKVKEYTQTKPHLAEPLSKHPHQLNRPGNPPYINPYRFVVAMMSKNWAPPLWVSGAKHQETSTLETGLPIARPTPTGGLRGVLSQHHLGIQWRTWHGLLKMPARGSIPGASWSCRPLRVAAQDQLWKMGLPPLPTCDTQKELDPVQKC